MEKILLVGSGGREHAIGKALQRSRHPHQLFVASSHINPGLSKIAQGYASCSVTDVDAIADFAAQHKIDWAIIGPEAPLEKGLADRLAALSISVVGPKKKLAQIETSKGFARKLLEKYNIPGSPRFKRFSAMNQELIDFLRDLGERYVIKADGLMSGKGVKVAGEHLADHAQAIDYCRSLFRQSSGLVIEEKLVGLEFSLLSFTDGTSLSHLPPVRDYKRAFIGDEGPNTGGMGAYTQADHQLKFVDAHLLRKAQRINEAVVKALGDEFGEPYVGILYGGFMVTDSGVNVIEFNARFGDPEAINLLAILKTDFVDICHAMLQGRLSKIDIQFNRVASVCKYFVPSGYPDDPIKGRPISLKSLSSAVDCYYASVEEQDGELILLGSRAIALVACGGKTSEASALIEQEREKIDGPLFHRPDVGIRL